MTFRILSIESPDPKVPSYIIYVCLGCGRRYIERPYCCTSLACIFNDRPRQEYLFTTEELRGPAPTRRWKVESRWKPRVWQQMLTRETTNRYAVMRTLGNPWDRCDLPLYSTAAAARTEAEARRKKYPEKSFRVRLVY